MSANQSLFVIVQEQNEPVVYKTPATNELLDKLSAAGSQLSNYSAWEDSKDLFLALSNDTPLAVFTRAAGTVPLEKVTVDDFLKTMGADGLDCFF